MTLDDAGSLISGLGCVATGADAAGTAADTAALRAFFDGVLVLGMFAPDLDDCDSTRRR